MWTSRDRQGYPWAHIRLAFTVSPYLTGMETSWRLESPWVAETSPGDLAGRGEIKHVRFFLRLFGDFFKSPVGLGDVAATSQRLNMFSRRKTSPRRLPRPARDQMIEEKLRRRLRNVAATSPRLGGDVSATTIDLLL